DHLLSRESGAITPEAPGAVDGNSPSRDPGRLEVRRPRRLTLLSFERPLHSAVYTHLENSIAATHVFFSIKRTRAHGGCLGAESRRRTWAAAKSPGEVLTDL